MPKEIRIGVTNLVEDYLKKGDVSTENANMGWGPNALLFNVGGEGLKKDNLNRLIEAGHVELAELHRMGGVHIHDLGLGYCVPYCVGLSLQTLIDKGITAGAVTSRPAKHINSIVNHMVNVIGSISNEVAGAVAFNDIDLLLAPYAYETYLGYLNAHQFVEAAQPMDSRMAMELARRDVAQAVQNLIWHLNFNNRWGGQSPFSNITLAITCPDDMRDQEAMVGGKPLYFRYPGLGNVTYGDLYDYQQMVAEAILDVFLAGDARGVSFTFPVLTINCTEELFSHPLRWKIWELTAKYGAPQFQNFVNGVTSKDKRLNPADVRSMCCRLSLDLEDLRGHTGGLFGHGDSTGSLQVVTVSLPFLAKYVSEMLDGHDGVNRKEAFFKELSRWMELIRDEQAWKREQVNYFYARNFFPIAKSSLPRGFETFFSTVGFIGLWECVEILTRDEMSFLADDGMELAEEILGYMQDKVNELTKQTGCLFNLEATPAESASYKLAKKALKVFPDIPHRGLKKAPYFSNSCHLPVEYADRLDLVFNTQSRLQTIPSGGTVTHFYVGEDLSPAEVEAAVKTICQTKIPFFSLSVIYSTCVKHGRLAGAHEHCPLCTEEDALEILQTRPDLVEKSND